MKTKHITLFVLILACGLLIEGLKGINGLSSDKSDKITSLSFRDLDTKPFYVSQSEIDTHNKRVKAYGGRAKSGFHLSANKSYKNILSATPPLTKNSAKKETEGDADSKKKKKKKNKSARANNILKENNEPSSDTQTDLEGSDYEAEDIAQSQSGAFAAQFVNPTTNNKTLPITYEDWAKLILGSPQPDNVSKLVDFFSNNMVSAEVFYGLLHALLEESNSEQHALAVFAAGNTPNPHSFIFLVQVLKTNAQGSLASIKAVEQIESYRTLHNVVYLKSVLSQSLTDINVVQTAVNALDKSTAQFLENRTPSAEMSDASDTSTTGDQTTLEKQAKIKKAFAGFESILESVIQTYQTNSEVTQPAQRSLTRIKNLTVVLAELSS